MSIELQTEYELKERGSFSYHVIVNDFKMILRQIKALRPSRRIRITLANSSDFNQEGEWFPNAGGDMALLKLDNERSPKRWGYHAFEIID